MQEVERWTGNELTNEFADSRGDLQTASGLQISCEDASDLRSGSQIGGGDLQIWAMRRLAATDANGEDDGVDQKFML